MNIQIFGDKKSSDTRKAERWFKERRIKFHEIDLREKPMSRGELRGVLQAAGGLAALLDENCNLFITASAVQWNNLASSSLF